MIFRPGYAQAVFARHALVAAQTRELATTFALHALPFGQLADYVINDNDDLELGDVILATASDTVLTLTGFGGVAKAAWKGVAGARAAVVYHRLHQANLAVEAFTLGYEAGNFATWLGEDDATLAEGAGTAGGILLRLLGIKWSLAEVDSARQAAQKGAELLQARKAFLNLQPIDPARPLTGRSVYIGMNLGNAVEFFEKAPQIATTFKAHQIGGATAPLLKIQSGGTLTETGLEAIEIVAGGRSHKFSVDQVKALLTDFGDAGVTDNLAALGKQDVMGELRELFTRRAGFYGADGATLNELLHGTGLKITLKHDAGHALLGKTTDLRKNIATHSGLDLGNATKN